MNTVFTVGDLVLFVVKNQKGDGFKEWTMDQLAHKMSKGIDEHTTFYSVDKSNQIDGVVVGTKDANKELIFVDGVLTTSPRVLRRFIQMFSRLYPNYRLEAKRHGKLVKYNTHKLVNKFSK